MASRSSATTASSSASTPPRRGLKRTTSTSLMQQRIQEQLCNSSDTEEPWTPPRKRFRFTKDEDSPTFKMFNTRGASSSPTSSEFGAHSPASSSVAGTPSTRRRRQANATPCDLTAVLRRCSSSVVIDANAIRDVKTFPRGEADANAAVKQVFHRVKVLVKARFDKANQKILATELYLEWLQELDFVVTAIEDLLAAKVPGTRKRVSGLGRLSFTILYQLLDEFISEVDSHHDGWSYRSPEFSARSSVSLYPETMTIIEESHDKSTDVRTDLAVREAEDFLTRYDTVMADAVRRYKIECGSRVNVNLADTIGTKEYTLARGCCLLCEQTGYGCDEDDTGDNLMSETRTAMMEWKCEFGSDGCEDLSENDQLTSD